jgi:hypothetical protein
MADSPSNYPQEGEENPLLPPGSGEGDVGPNLNQRWAVVRQCLVQHDIELSSGSHRDAERSA